MEMHMLPFRKAHQLILSLVFVLPTTLFACAVSVNAQTQFGDPIAGKDVYNRCIGCHSPKQNRTGPKHCGLFDRKAGSVSGFDYSEALRKSNIVWNKKTLDTFIKSPLENIPGTTMGFAGIKNDKARADLIAYLQQIQSNECK
jgi:cytochrome c